jgi:phosphoenolpyruvate-protein kinase (PTS system EI component)
LLLRSLDIPKCIETGQEVGAVAKQQLISLDAVDSIVGIQVTNSHIFVTTE